MLLSIEHLSVEYYRRGKVISAAQDVSLRISAGETLGLVGESGSGKSTVALAILRLIGRHEGRITSGRILFEEKDLLALDEEALRGLRGKEISMIFQDPFTSLNPVLRIEEQLYEALKAHALPAVSLTDVLSHVQLDDSNRILHSYPHQLSGGQRQRVMIAMAILAKPRLLIADEPTTALDVVVQKDILRLLFSLQRELKMAILLITHNLGIVAEYTHRIAVMQQGRVVEEAETARIFQQPRHSYTQKLLEALPRLTRSESKG